jgi:hypothetical protein
MQREGKRKEIGTLLLPRRLLHPKWCLRTGSWDGIQREKCLRLAVFA